MSDDLFVIIFIAVAGIIALVALIFVWRLENGGSNETKEAVNDSKADLNTESNMKS